MAVSATILKRTMEISYVVGTDDNGKEIFKKQSFSQIRTDAEDEKLFAVATGLGQLLEPESVKISKKDNILLTV